MNFVIKNLLMLLVVNFGHSAAAYASGFDQLLKKRVYEGGWIPASQLYFNPDEKLSSAGRLIFESEKLSLNGFISCRTCHQDKFGSADGIPNAAAIGYHRLSRHGSGKIVGPDRLLAGAKQLPRNTLPFWGRGAKGFDTFFWDGRVEARPKGVTSQFGSKAPSGDAFLTAVHLPVVEIREMLDEDEFVEQNKLESVATAKKIYAAIAKNLIEGEPLAAKEIAGHLRKDVRSLEYTDFARAIAAFIRSEFRIKPTKLERFMQGKERLSSSEIKGGLLFYGKGGCVSCHTGPHFSDFKFYSLGFPQLGFGKNGFGVDYGRYNTTFNTNDLYKFRTPPLYNVEKTAPYGHSGSLSSLEDVIAAHFDPLRFISPTAINAYERHEWYRRMALSGDASLKVRYLSDAEIKDVVEFLRALSF